MNAAFAVATAAFVVAKPFSDCKQGSSVVGVNAAFVVMKAGFPGLKESDQEGRPRGFKP